MRFILPYAALLLAAATTATPAQAQGGEFMWCTATADNGEAKAYYYSAFFPAGAWEAERKALAFKREVEGQHVSAAIFTVTATCMPPADYDGAIATRNAVMKSAPGTIVSWEG